MDTVVYSWINIVMLLPAVCGLLQSFLLLQLQKCKQNRNITAVSLFLYGLLQKYYVVHRISGQNLQSVLLSCLLFLALVYAGTGKSFLCDYETQTTLFFIKGGTFK